MYLTLNFENFLVHLYPGTSVLEIFFQIFAKVDLVFKSFLVVFLKSKVDLVSIYFKIFSTCTGIIIN